jgi:hypothetical protein
VKIKGIHTVCGREVLVQQIVESGGHCPWDGQPFNNDYTAMLAEALLRAEIGGSALVEALEAIADLHGDLQIVDESVLAEPAKVLERIREPKPARTA